LWKRRNICQIRFDKVNDKVGDKGAKTWFWDKL